jgi:hypothetical protein
VKERKASRWHASGEPVKALPIGAGSASPRTHGLSLQFDLTDTVPSSTPPNELERGLTVSVSSSAQRPPLPAHAQPRSTTPE